MWCTTPIHYYWIIVLLEMKLAQIHAIRKFPCIVSKFWQRYHSLLRSASHDCIMYDLRTLLICAEDARVKIRVCSDDKAYFCEKIWYDHLSPIYSNISPIRCHMPSMIWPNFCWQILQIASLANISICELICGLISVSEPVPMPTCL